MIVSMVKQPTRADLAYRVLRQAIIEQALAPGSKLPEDELGSHFGMSRTLARATLSRLQADGLVETAHKRTATVARPTLEEARDVFEVRRTLERQVVELVCARWKASFGAELEGHVREEDQARAKGDPRLSIRLAGEFHLRLAAMTGNRILEAYVSQLVSRCSLILALYGRPHSSDCAINEHREIIEALRRGDPAEAARLMDHHVGAVEQRALIRDAGQEPSLDEVLSRYTGRGADVSRVTPIAGVRARSRP